MQRYKTGKTPARHGAMKLRFGDFVKKGALPKHPEFFGHEGLIKAGDWGMLGNDAAGCCVWAGGGHETRMWGYEGGKPAYFSTKATLSDYSAVTGYDPSKTDADGNNPTDNGTDMVKAAQYRKDVGLLDGHGGRHKVGDFLSITPGNLEEHLAAAYLFGAVGIGILFPDVFMDQFNAGKPWDIASKPATQDGHYIPLVAHREVLTRRMLPVVTWGKVQLMTEEAFANVNDESIVYISPEAMKGGKSPEGFDMAGLKEALTALA